MTPEQKARQQIDRQLDQAGWLVQDYRAMNMSAGLGVAVFKDPSLEDSDDLPEPEVLAQEIADDLQTALEMFTAVAEKVKG